MTAVTIAPAPTGSTFAQVVTLLRDDPGWQGVLGFDELLQSGLRLGAHGRNPQVTRRVSRIVEMLGFERRRPRGFGAAGRSYCYVSVGLDPPGGPTGPTGPTTTELDFVDSA